MNRFTKIAAVIAMFSALAISSCGPSTSSGSSTSAVVLPKGVVFTKSACPFQVTGSFIDGKTVICGFVAVPADQVNPNSNNMIKIAVAIFKSTAAKPSPIPMIFLQGGPGGRIIQDFAPLLMQDPAIIGDRDMILVDQRGTGYSQPNLSCPQLTALQTSTLDENISAQQGNTLQNQALTQCKAQLTGEGINLADYTTYNDAADIHDLIFATGYKQADVYGVSYGTRVALEIMRAFPQGVHSVILDSTIPPQIDFITSIPTSTARVFNQLYQGCASNATCSAAYPNLANTLYSLYAKLQANPITFQTVDSVDNNTYTVLFNGDSLVGLLYQIFYYTPGIEFIPAVINQVSQGNITVNSLTSQLFGGLTFDNSTSYGVYFSVVCSEENDTTQQVDQASQAYPAAIRPDQQISMEGYIQACAIWNTPKVPQNFFQPVTSNIPTLIMEGEYDPITPPANGNLVHSELPNSFVEFFKGAGHGVFLSDFQGDKCSISVVETFWDNPTTAPTLPCIAQTTEPNFQVTAP